MSTYAIGDVQGCFDELQQLLALIQFDPQKDRLWFAGDLVNRGPKSLAVLRLVSSLGTAVQSVLGNHDLHLLARYYCHLPPDPKDTLTPILAAGDCDQLMQWLVQQPLCVYDETLDITMSHAGIYPLWSLAQARGYAAEVEAVLQSDQVLAFMQNLYGNQPEVWSEQLTGWERLRFIVNAFTRMRACNESALLLNFKGSLSQLPKGAMPWFCLPNRKMAQQTILFGHWAALEGKSGCEHAIALDTGCYWGGALTAMRLEDRRFFHVPALKKGK